jgi:transcriptional regulator with XRE-family HTH domain
MKTLNYTAQQLVQLLLDSGLSQSEICEKTGVLPSNISRIAQGKTTGEETYRKLAKLAISKRLPLK